MSFTLDLDHFVAKAGLRTDAVLRRVAMEVTKSVVLKTPVDTGRARANWVSSVGTLPVSTTSATDISGSSAINAALGATKNFTAGTVYYVANNLPYIQRLEDGWSGQAPSGMVSLSMLELMTKFNSVAAQAASDVK